jgi:hypothetical protein
VERAYDWLYRRLGRRYLILIAGIETISAMLIALASLGVFSLYIDVSTAQFLRILLVTELFVLVGLALATRSMRSKWTRASAKTSIRQRSGAARSRCRWTSWGGASSSRCSWSRCPRPSTQLSS